MMKVRGRPTPASENCRARTVPAFKPLVRRGASQVLGAPSGNLDTTIYHLLGLARAILVAFGTMFNSLCECYHLITSKWQAAHITSPCSVCCCLSAVLPHGPERIRRDPADINFALDMPAHTPAPARTGRRIVSCASEGASSPLEVLRQENSLLRQTIHDAKGAVAELETAISKAGEPRSM